LESEYESPLWVSQGSHSHSVLPIPGHISPFSSMAGGVDHN
jgi:hypothetical protein